MPGPLIKSPELPWWADPKGASVMDPLYVTLARKAAGILGADDPNSQVMNIAGGPLATTVESKGLSPLLKAIFTKSPEAEGVYNKAMASQLPEVLANRQASNAAKYATNARAHDALLDLAVSGRPRPIPTATGFDTAIPLGSPSPTINRPAVGPSMSLGLATGGDSTLATKLKKSGLTEDIIRDMRALGPELAAKKYKNMPATTVRGIAVGDSWSRIK